MDIVDHDFLSNFSSLCPHFSAVWLGKLLERLLKFFQINIVKNLSMKTSKFPVMHNEVCPGSNA